MDNETGVIFNDEQGKCILPSTVCDTLSQLLLWLISVRDGGTDGVDDFAIPGAADAFGLWPSPWNYPAPGKK